MGGPKTVTRCRLVVLTNCSAFKLAVVLGPSRVAGKLRVRTYSRNARDWSHPHTVLETNTRPAVMAALDDNHRATLRYALIDGESMGAYCAMA